MKTREKTAHGDVGLCLLQCESWLGDARSLAYGSG